MNIFFSDYLVSFGNPVNGLRIRLKYICILLDVLLRSIAEYFYELCRILQQYKQRVKTLSDTTQQNV